MRVRNLFQRSGRDQRGFWVRRRGFWGWGLNQGGFWSRAIARMSFSFPRQEVLESTIERPENVQLKPPEAHDIFAKCRNFTRADEARRSGVYPYFYPIESAQEPEITVDGRRMLMLGSNSYLGLTTHPKVKEAALAAVRRYGSSCAGSRFLNGTSELHEELERELAEFVGKEQAIVFTTGYQANLGAISTIVGRGDCIYTDKVDHASIYDGARLAYGRLVRFSHNDARDLDRVLTHHDAKGKLVVVDGVFSMDGDIADLPGIVAVCKRHNASLMVDDAHGLGVLGPKGCGTTAHFGLDGDVAIIMGTFSKSFASIGGFVASDAKVIDYIRHHARSLIFSASLPPAQTASALAALRIMRSEPERIEKLWENTRILHDGLNDLGFDTGDSETPIIPVIVGDDLLCFKTWLALREAGIFVNPIIAPAVLSGQALIRISIMATHEHEHLYRALEIFEKVGKELGLI